MKEKHKISALNIVLSLVMCSLFTHNAIAGVNPYLELTKLESKAGLGSVEAFNASVGAGIALNYANDEADKARQTGDQALTTQANLDGETANRKLKSVQAKIEELRALLSDAEAHLNTAKGNKEASEKVLRSAVDDLAAKEKAYNKNPNFQTNEAFEKAKKALTTAQKALKDTSDILDKCKTSFNTIKSGIDKAIDEVEKLKEYIPLPEKVSFALPSPEDSGIVLFDPILQIHETLDPPTNQQPDNSASIGDLASVAVPQGPLTVPPSPEICLDPPKGSELTSLPLSTLSVAGPLPIQPAFSQGQPQSAVYNFSPKRREKLLKKDIWKLRGREL